MAKRLTPKTVAEEPRSGVSKDEATEREILYAANGTVQAS